MNAVFTPLTLLLTIVFVNATLDYFHNANLLILLATELQSLYLQQFLIIERKRMLCGHRNLA